MSEYTPTTDTIRAGYIDARCDRTPERVRAEFDRWLASVKAEVAAKALEDFADEYDADPMRDPFTHDRPGLYARIRAAAYRSND
jgi:hypothetical protein